MFKFNHGHHHNHHNNNQDDFQLPDFRSDIAGAGNNLENPEFNQSGTDFIRLGDANFLNDDGITPEPGPNPRDISNILVSGGPDPEEGNPEGLSDFMYVFGQFLDHDLDLQRSGTTPFNVDVPPGDPTLDPSVTTIPVNRIAIDPDSGTPENPAIGINDITGWIDGSMIYGSDDVTAANLRDIGGKLKVSEGNFLPIDPNTDQFIAGDIRVGENPNLTSMHTLFVREHNFQVDQLSKQNPELTDEQLYQTAKAITTAELQNIVYNEYLPHLIGKDAIVDYQGYDPNVDPRISQEFAGAAFRFGHSIVSPGEEQINEFGELTNEQALRDSFFEPASKFISEGGADSLLRSLASEQSPPLDQHIVDDLRDFLSDPPNAIDLASTNIQRAHDMGLGSLNETREAIGLTPYTSFDQISSDPVTQAALSQAYGGDINAIDLWTGGLSENHVEGAFVGETFQNILADQFTRLRDGDRFFFENQNFDAKTLAEIKGTSFSDLIVRNTDTDHMQEDAFIATERHSGSAGPTPDAENPDGPQLIIGTAGVNDMLTGGPADDTLVASAGDHHGRQILTGGEGADTFVIEKGAKFKIADFEKGIDTIQREHAMNSKWDGDGHYKVAADKVAADLVDTKHNVAIEKVGAATDKVAAIPNKITENQYTEENGMSKHDKEGQGYEHGNGHDKGEHGGGYGYNGEHDNGHHYGWYKEHGNGHHHGQDTAPEAAYVEKAAYEPAYPEKVAEAPVYPDKDAAPAYEAPAYPDKDAPAYEPAAYPDKDAAPVYEAPAYPDKDAAPAYEAPAYPEKAAYEPAYYDKDAAPAYEAPAYYPDKEAPAYEPAAYPDKDAAPAYEAPAYPDKEAPAYEPAAYPDKDAAPAYEPPAYPDKDAAPAYEPPAYPDKEAAPAYEAPAYPDKDAAPAYPEKAAYEPAYPDKEAAPAYPEAPAYGENGEHDHGHHYGWYKEHGNGHHYGHDTAPPEAAYVEKAAYQPAYPDKAAEAPVYPDKEAAPAYPEAPVYPDKEAAPAYEAPAYLDKALDKVAEVSAYAADKVAEAAEFVATKNDIAGEKVAEAADKVADNAPDKEADAPVYPDKADENGGDYYNKAAEKDSGDYYNKPEDNGGGDYKDYVEQYNHHNYDGGGEHHASYAHHDYWG